MKENHKERPALVVGKIPNGKSQSKAMVRGYSWVVVPVAWRNRRFGAPKLKLKEMGSRYFFICAYVWLEKYFNQGDYKQPGTP
jgi:hypothetical protein